MVQKSDGDLKKERVKMTKFLKSLSNDILSSQIKGYDHEEKSLILSFLKENNMRK